MSPPSERLTGGSGSWFDRGHMVAHCLLIESSDGLVLVDSGISTADVHDAERRLGSMFVNMLRPLLDERITALRQIEALGYQQKDVRHIVLTHLDVDHAGGLIDFPDATVHVYAQEHEAAMNPQTLPERERYRSIQWAHGPNWQLHDEQGERFEGLAAVRAIVEPEVLLIPTLGHTRGHACVAVNSGDGWLVHCGDAYFHRNEMEAEPSCPLGLAMFQRLVAIDDSARRHNQRRLRALKQRASDNVHVFSAHDPIELEALAE